jgi:hypothetical protein
MADAEKKDIEIQMYTYNMPPLAISRSVVICIAGTLVNYGIIKKYHKNGVLYKMRSYPKKGRGDYLWESNGIRILDASLSTI